MSRSLTAFLVFALLRTGTAHAQEATEPKCTTHRGPVQIRNSSDWAQFVAKGCTSINGRLTIDVSDASELTPPATTLTSVVDLKIVEHCALTNFSLPALTEVKHELFISSTDCTANKKHALASLDLPSLQTVRNLLIYGSALTNLTLPALTSANHLEIEGLKALTSINLPALTTVGTGGLRVAANAQLTEIALPSLQEAATFGVTGNPNLAGLSLPSLTVSYDEVLVQDNAKLVSISLPLLTNVGPPTLATTKGKLNLSKNAVLATVDLPQLAMVGYRLLINDNSNLTAILLPGLASAGGIEINNNNKLAGLELPALSVVGRDEASCQIFITQNTALRLCLVNAIVSRLARKPHGQQFLSSGNKGMPNNCP